MSAMIEVAERIVRGETAGPPIAQLVGFTLTQIEAGMARIQLEAGERHHNPMGTVHGGVICDIADAAIGMAYASTLGEGETLTTVELKVNFLKQVRDGRLRAEGRVVHVGVHEALEDQMCLFGADGLVRGRSPDRLDALVWVGAD